MRRLHHNFLIVLLVVQPALALIQVGRGNDPVRDDNWPAGSLEVANLKSRIGWWEGPPFGGGQWEFSYRGDEAELQKAIELFAKINWPRREIVVHEGPHTIELIDKGKVDWTFMVWNPRNWNSLYNGPGAAVVADYPDGRFRSPVDPPRLEVYVAPAGGVGIDWAKVKVPAGVTVRDERATANGYDASAGSVIRGRVYDMTTSKPLVGAKISLAEGNLSDVTDGEGKFEISNLKPGRFTVVASAEGYVARLVCYASLGNNALREEVVHLATSARLKGVVKETTEKPLSGVKVRAATVIASDGRAYVLGEKAEVETDEKGAFELMLPAGQVRLDATRAPLHQLEVLKMHSVPKEGVVIRMEGTGRVVGKVVKPDGSAVSEGDVSVNPPGSFEDHVGKWGGGRKINADGTFQFDQVPPGKYLVSADAGLAVLGKDPRAKEIEVKAGETTEVTVTKAK